MRDCISNWYLIRKCLRTYDPSGRFDSGMTRSSVFGSTAIPAAEVFGTMSGFDMSTTIGRQERLNAEGKPEAAEVLMAE